jgi:hypothetical protein
MQRLIWNKKYFLVNANIKSFKNLRSATLIIFKNDKITSLNLVTWQPAYYGIGRSYTILHYSKNKINSHRIK